MVNTEIGLIIFFANPSNNYTVEVRNRFKGLDLIECLKNYGWRFVILYRRQGSTIPKKTEKQKGKMAV